MFITWEFIVFIIVLKSIAGSTIGAIETAAYYRSLISWTGMVRGVVLGAVGFLVGSYLAGWAGTHEAFYNGKRVDIAPWGENLWLRNRIVEHEFFLSFALATIAVAAGHRIFGTRRSKEGS